MTNVITPEMVEQIKEMRASGMAKRLIADALHVRVARIRPIIEGIASPSRERFNWPDEKVERLKALWAQGCSARVIAQTLGGYTRNAILGKLSRLGLTKCASSGTPSKTSSSVRSRGPRSVPIAIEPHQIDGRYITIMDLEADMCRWPIGDPRDSDFHFCGHPSASGRSYCEHHLSRSVEKPREDLSHIVRKTIPTVWLRGIAA